MDTSDESLQEIFYELRVFVYQAICCLYDPLGIWDIQLRYSRVMLLDMVVLKDVAFIILSRYSTNENCKGGADEYNVG